MKLLIAGSSKETGALLREYLDVRGVSHKDDAVVCYGLGHASTNTLNGECGTNKIDRLISMKRAGVTTVPWFIHEMPKDLTFPLLARKTSGFGGTDIVPVFQEEELKWRKEAGWDWFSQFIPVANEYRVWVFRDTFLDAYEKVMHRPTDFKFIGRNFRNGFDFEPVTSAPRDAVSTAFAAVKAIKLDFGAVDLLRGKDGRVYVLEVNTAPGVIKSGAQATLGKLADCIVRWEKEGYPKW